jgi:hypothetical protein
MNTTNDTRYFIAVAANEADRLTIDVIGHMVDEAIQDAHAGIGSGMTDHGFVAQECTKALYDYVVRNGGAGLSWEKNTEGLQDVADEE